MGPRQDRRVLLDEGLGGGGSGGTRSLSDATWLLTAHGATFAHASELIAARAARTGGFCISIIAPGHIIASIGFPSRMRCAIV